MRHRKKGKILDRKKAPRKALLRSLATSLILYEKIKTTKAKAKTVRPLVERLITAAKKNDLNSRRKLLSVLYHKKAVAKALEVLGPRYQERAGGYTRIIKLGRRQGDNAEIAQIELV
ncbi:MAG: 50S ribosomal protein L17 [Candidatus Buchananbacteria bacterium RIFCSPHIGHO2_01_FULL_39_14]|uniref:Large ribosomal subunit protein bL17 n=2 Tax=Candidatus Buchananiibacteriota TaxID=1817903 RepID=A0A1G1YSU5_9BACT|nr:MAG: 50S ribosomal protein L17 [Candidatus Buchananbacteria bacterium RIFCSPHIGHO2_01_FULL_39_14]OGY48880.1 MAG: 50S ribosomal protein L17 [Candidatus Buchananbacteria bacterium RIFCSPHIGHO2_02_FULL_39_17]OGY55442.1 MAG: 50S ribosomal protein L17 [Candidatus Buchananbacteria bacterium RIFCSPLOWO2_01_FULL_40_23b]